jgi:ribonuclease P protein component
MLSKDKRIPRSLMNTLMESKRYFNTNHFTLMAGGSEENVVRIGASVSKKISKSAATRNTIRRRVYSSIKVFIPYMKPGIFLFVAKKGADKVKGEMLEKEIEEALASAKIIVSQGKKG